MQPHDGATAQRRATSHRVTHGDAVLAPQCDHMFKSLCNKKDDDRMPGEEWYDDDDWLDYGGRLRKAHEGDTQREAVFKEAVKQLKEKVPPPTSHSLAWPLKPAHKNRPPELGTQTQPSPKPGMR